MTAALLDVLLPVFVVLAAGVVLGRTLRLEIGPLNRLGLYGAVPALVFTSLATTELAAASVGVLVAGQLLFLLTMGGAAALLSRLLEGPQRRGFVATSLFGNSGNMMLPLALFAFGEAGLGRALVLFVLSSVVLFSCGPLVLAPSRGLRELPLGGVLRLPVLWAALLGLACNALGVLPPTGVMRGLDLLGDAAIPVVLLVLGLQIGGTGMLRPSPMTLFAAAFKLVGGPLLGFACAWLVGARGLDLAVLVLLAAMPPAVNTFMLSLEFGGDAEEVARTVVLATFGAALSVSATLWLLGRFVLPL